MVEDKDILKDFFHEKLNDFQIDVPDTMWSSISQRIPSHATTSLWSTTTILSKTLIGVFSLSFISVAVFFVINDDTTEKSPASIQGNTKEEKQLVQRIENKEIIERKVISGEHTILEKQKESSQKVEEPSFTYETDQNVNTSPNKYDVPVNTNQPNTINTKDISSTINYNEVKEKPVVTIDKKESDFSKNNLSEESVDKNQIAFSLPNVFTPNNDGVNDFFMIEGIDLKEFSLVVLDQSNEVVYKSNDTDFMWDGVSLKGILLQSGSYLYFVSGRDNKGNIVYKQSSLKIIR